ncbi:MerR family DNA-binding protein [Thalassotalea sp. PS06]|uniref:MerR family DNA-binding protein n=1 Tax=Thalassotalea sp. PS06 TaxID=2594005 RepID=UPI00391D2104
MTAAIIAVNTIRVITVIKISISLAQIKQQFDQLPNHKKVTTSDWQQLSRNWHQQLDEQIKALTALRDNIDGCIGCGCLSMKRCQLVNPGDIAAEQGPGLHIETQ